MVSQFEHNTELYLTNNEFDLGERELDLALSLEYDVDFFVAALALTKTGLSEAIKEDRVAISTAASMVRISLSKSTRVLTSAVIK